MENQLVNIADIIIGNYFLTILFYKQRGAAIVNILRFIAIYRDDLLTVHMVGSLDTAGKCTELFYHFVNAVNIHGQRAIHMNHNVRIFRKEFCLRIHLAFQIGKLIDNFTDCFFGF